MTVTRANVESVLIRRAGRLMTAAGMDGTTIVGTNADLNDPIGWAARQLGLTVADIGSVADADLAGVLVDDLDSFLDLAELRTLENILGNLNMVDISLGPRSESLSQLATQVERKAERLRVRIQSEHGLGLGTLDAGVISLDFAQKGESE